MFQNANYPIARYSYCTYYENTHFEDQLTNEKGNFGVFLNGIFFLLTCSLYNYYNYNC